jgi:hypothetical protein
MSFLEDSKQHWQEVIAGALQALISEAGLEAQPVKPESIVAEKPPKPEMGDIGFLSDLRRMNVAITRARMKLVILGDGQTMRRHRFYRELLQYIETLSANHP